jgi:hypothetical protein
MAVGKQVELPLALQVADQLVDYLVVDFDYSMHYPYTLIV